MKVDQLVSAGAWLAVGLVFGIGSWRMGLGEISEPGPGFFPLIMSACLVAFSLVYLVSLLRQVRKAPAGGSFLPGRGGLLRVSLLVSSLFGFIFAMDYIGFCLTSFFFISFLLKLVEPRRWHMVLLIAGLTTATSYAIFQLWLRADLPAGPLGF